MTKRIFLTMMFLVVVACSAINAPDTTMHTQSNQIANDNFVKRYRDEIQTSAAILMLISVLIMGFQMRRTKNNSIALKADMEGMTSSIKKQFEELVTHTHEEFESLAESINTIFVIAMQKQMDIFTDEIIHRRKEKISKLVLNIQLNIPFFIEILYDNYGIFASGKPNLVTEKQKFDYNNYLIIHQKLLYDISTLENYIKVVSVEKIDMGKFNLFRELINKQIVGDNDESLLYSAIEDLSEYANQLNVHPNFNNKTDKTL